MANTIQIKRGAFASLPTLAEGELGYSTDTEQIHIGDGAANHEVMLHDNYNATSFMYATSDNTPQNKTPAEVMAILSGTATAAFAMNSQKITGVTDPTAAQDAATKAYVDSVAQGLNVHTAVACATTANIALTGEQTLDGILTATDRVLVKDQTDATENGIYVSAAGAWARAADLDASAEVAGSFVFVSDGTTLGCTGWVCTNEPETVGIGTSDMTFAQFSDAGYVTASSGLAKTGNDIAPTGLLEDLNTLGACSADSEVMVGTGAGAMAWESGATLRTSLGLAIGTDVLAQQTIGIADNNLVEIDDADAAALDYAKFTANGLEGRSYAEVMGDLSGTAAAAFSMNSQQITSLLDPSLAQDAATKAYVDSVAGTDVLDVKKSCHLATAAALPACTAAGSGVGKTLTADAVGVLTVDGVATVLNDRVLVMDQVTGADNGIYKCTTEGTAGVAFVLTRSTDFDASAEVTAGAFTFIEEGTANANKGFVLTTNNTITLDTTALVFSQFSGDGSDGTAIHDNVANEISAITLKAAPVAADELIIEDSAASYAKKSITIGTIPIDGGTFA